MEKNYNDYFDINTKKKLKPSHSFLSRKYHTQNNNNNIMDNNMNADLLKEKIKSQKKDIEYLKNRLKNYDETISEVTRLNLELNKMNEILKKKNETILEYQNLSEVSKTKFNNYLNRANSKKLIFEKKEENYEQLKSKNNYLIEQIKIMEKENKSLQHKLNSIKNKNLYEIDHIRNEIDVINIEYEKEKKQNMLINEEKIRKNKEIIDLKTKLIACNKFKEEINNINNKYNILEKQINEKDQTIEELTNINNNLKDKIEISNDNYNQVVYDQKNLELKLNNLIDKVKEYEIILKDEKNKNKYNNNYNTSVDDYNNTSRMGKNLDNSYYTNYSRGNHNHYPIRNNSNKYIFLNGMNRHSKSPDYNSKISDYNYNFNYKNF